MGHRDQSPGRDERRQPGVQPPDLVLSGSFRRDHNMTNEAENRGQKGVVSGPPGVLQTVSGCADSRPDLRFYPERVTGIEPACPAWQAGLTPSSATARRRPRPGDCR